MRIESVVSGTIQMATRISTGMQRMGTVPVFAAISARDEYLWFRKALAEHILKRIEMKGVEMKRLFQAREEGLELLKSKISVTP